MSRRIDSPDHILRRSARAELAIAATARVSRIALVAADDVLAGPTAEILAGADVVRFAPRRAGEALHAFLRERQRSGGELVAARDAR